MNEPSLEDTIKILEGLRPSYEEFHGVKFTPEAIKAAGESSHAKYMHDKKLPDKAIDLLDEAGAAAKLSLAGSSAAAAGSVPIVGVPEVEIVLSRMAHVPPRGGVEETSDKERSRRPSRRT